MGALTAMAATEKATVDPQSLPLDSRMLMAIGVIVVGYFVSRLVTRMMAGVPFVKPEEAHKALEENPESVIIDLRPPRQFSGEPGHIEGSLNLPFMDLMGRLKEIRGDLAEYADTPLLVVCRSGHAAARAARILRKEGLNKVAVLDGGIKAWIRAKLPLVR